MSNLPQRSSSGGIGGSADAYWRAKARIGSGNSSVFESPLLPVISYCIASIIMTTTNKYVLSPGFNLNFFILTVQSLVATLAIVTCKKVGIIKFRDFNSNEATKWLPITIALISMVYTGSKAIQFLSIPVYTIFKNLTIILIAYGEVLWFGGSVTSKTLLSFGLMVLSSIVAAWSDLQFTANDVNVPTKKLSNVINLGSGYIWMLVNCVCSAVYILGMRKRIKVTGFKDFDTMFYNNLLSIPILILCSLLLEDWSYENLIHNFPIEYRNTTIFAMIFSGLSTVGISYTSAWCVRKTSSTTYSFVGSLNKLPIAIAGIIFFDAPVSIFSVIAIILGFLSGLMYAYAKYLQQKEKDNLDLPMTNKL